MAAPNVDDFLRAYPEEQLRREIEQLEMELLDKREELELVQRWKHLRALEDGSQPDGGHEADAEAEGERQPARVESEGADAPATRREAIETVMRERPNHSWKLSELREALVARGWLPDDEASNHRLQVTASRMAKRRQLRRPRQGYYRLPPERRDGSE